MNIGKILRITVLVLLIASCGWSIFSGYISQPLKGILIAIEILVLLIAGWSLSISLEMRKFKNMTTEEKIQNINDPVCLELRTYLRERLLSLNFEEQYDFGFGPIFKYTRDNLLVELQKDNRDHYYYFRASSKTEAVLRADGSHAYDRHIFDIDIEIGTNSRDLARFKAEIREELPKWLAEQNVE